MAAERATATVMFRAVFGHKKEEGRKHGGKKTQRHQGKMKSFEKYFQISKFKLRNFHTGKTRIYVVHGICKVKDVHTKSCTLLVEILRFSSPG